MSKSDHKFVDTQEDSGWYELRDWLTKNGFKGGSDNRDKLREVIDQHIRSKKGDNVSWEELNEYLAKNLGAFDNLEKT